MPVLAGDSYSLYVPLKRMSRWEETKLIKQALSRAGIRAHVKHYLGALVVEIGRPVEDGDWDNIRRIVEEALGKPDAYALGGLHIFDKFEGKVAAAWIKGNRGMFF